MFIRTPLFLITKRCKTTITQAFKKADIVPDIISIPPSRLLDVKYVKNFRIATNVKPISVMEKPGSVRWEPVDYNKLHTLVMTEPESPTRTDPNQREMLHWLVVNIRGDLVFNGDTLAEYIGVMPPEDTGPHRYVFLIFSQQNIIDITKETYLNDKTLRGRNNFSVSTFQINHNLSDAIAGNFFYAEHDSSVPKLNKKYRDAEKELLDSERKAAIIKSAAIQEKRKQRQRNS